jgi:hypothetical protein
LGLETLVLVRGMLLPIIRGLATLISVIWDEGFWLP